MASEPAEPDRGALGRGLRQRTRSLVTRKSITGRALPTIGHLGARTRAFGRLAGLSVLDRVAVQRTLWPQASAMAASLVRPPADFWGANSGDDTPSETATSFAPVLRLTNAEPLSPTLPTTGNAKYDALIRSMRADDGESSGEVAASSTAASPIRPSHRTRRGLPSTIRRRGASRAGRATAPGGAGRRFVPQPVAPAPTEATRHMYVPTAAPGGETPARRPFGPDASARPGPAAALATGALFDRGPVVVGGGTRAISLGAPMRLATKRAPLSSPSRSVLSVARQPTPTTVARTYRGQSRGLVSRYGTDANITSSFDGSASGTPLSFEESSSVAVLERPSAVTDVSVTNRTPAMAPLLRTLIARRSYSTPSDSTTTHQPASADTVAVRRVLSSPPQPEPTVEATADSARADGVERAARRRGRGFARNTAPSSVGRTAPVVRLSRRPGFRPSLPLASRPPRSAAAPLSDPRLHGEVRRTIDGRAVVRPGSTHLWAAAASVFRAESAGAHQPARRAETRRRDPDVDHRPVDSIAAPVTRDSSSSTAPGPVDQSVVAAAPPVESRRADTAPYSETADGGVVRSSAMPYPAGATVSARPGRFFSAPVAGGQRDTVSAGARSRHRPLSVLPVSPLLRALQRSIDPSPAPATTAPKRSSPLSTAPRSTEPVVSPPPAPSQRRRADGADSMASSAAEIVARPVSTGEVHSDADDARSTDPARISLAAPVAPPSLAERFMSELQQRRAEAPRPLPMQFRPLARHVAGHRPVRIASGPASRDALAAVGKVAATTGDTVHLARTPDTSRRSVEVLAHELTHVAHPSPAPRFFDDDHDSVEERRAEIIGRVMAAEPRLVSAGGLATSSQAAVVSRELDPTRPVGTAHLPVGTPMQMLNASPSASPTPAHSTIQRAPADDGFVTADEMVRRSSPGGGWGQTEPTGRGRMAVGSHRTRTPTPNQRDTMTDPPTATPDVAVEPASVTPSDDQSLLGQLFENTSSSEYHDFVDAVVDALERRIMSELDRRGGRFRGGI